MVDTGQRDRAFYEEPMPPVAKMSKEDLQKELQNWRNLWTWVDNEVRGWLVKVGHNFKFRLQNYEVYYGTLGKPHFEVTKLELDCIVENKDYLRHKLVTDFETMHIGLGRLVSFEEVHERQELPLNERGEVEEDVVFDDVPELIT